MMNSLIRMIAKSLTLPFSMLAGLLLCDAAYGAVGFTISPAAVTNDFRGTISLTVTGLVAGGSVVIEQYADLNGNGVIDSGEFLVLHLTVTDGQVPLVAGIRNPNVVGDEDGLSNGQIQARFYFPWVGFVWSAAVKSVFKVSDPLGVFPAVTRPFSVAQKIYPQLVTGRITDAGSGFPLTNAIVFLSLQQGSGGPISSTDTNGNYKLYYLPSTATVGVLKPGYVTDQNKLVVMNCNQTVTNELALTNTPFTISGKLTDTNGGGIAGILVGANSTTNGFSANGFTDTNGNYSLSVYTNNQWRVRPDQRGLSQVGFVGLANRTNVTVANLSISNVDFQLLRASALIYGTLKDDHGNPLIGQTLGAVDAGSPPRQGDGRSFVTNGSYALGVIGGTDGIGGDGATLALLGLTLQNTNVAITDGHATNVDLVAVRINFPSLSNPSRLSATAAQFLFTGLPAVSYNIQASSNLSSTNWLTLLNTNGSCNAVTIVDSNATSTARFYRAVVVP